MGADAAGAWIDRRRVSPGLLHPETNLGLPERLLCNGVGGSADASADASVDAPTGTFAGWTSGDDGATEPGEAGAW